MRRNRLNITVLRDKWVNRGSRRVPRISQLASPKHNYPVTRREFLGVAGSAAVTASPALKAIEKAVIGPFEFESTRNRAVFKLGGEERWVIDTRFFTGSPKLKVTKKDDIILLKLTRAKYPGTDLPADLKGVVRRGFLGWNMKLYLALGNFAGQFSLVRWLAGLETAHSPVTCAGRVCGLGNTSHLEISGSAEAEFSPDWVLHFEGSHLSKLSGMGKEIVSDNCTVSLLEPQSASIMNTTVSKRTLITMERGERRWFLKPRPYKGKNWKLIGDSDLFDSIQIEVGESNTGKIRSALVAESDGGESRLFFKPDGRLKDREGRPFQLPLQNPRYAIAFDSTGDETAIVSDFSRDGAWLQTDRIGLQLGGSPSGIPFMLTGRNGKLERLQCEPELLALNAPMKGAIVEPIAVSNGTRLSFMQDQQKRVQPKQEKKVGQVQEDRRLRPSLQLPASFKVSVVRPKDLLTLNFEFFNFNLKADEGQPVYLQRIDKNKPAYIVAEFPPQNIAEEAFFRTDDIDVKLPEYVKKEDHARKDPDQDRKEDDTFRSPPVQSRLSAPSRLAFLVPREVDKIEYSLESLLDWRGFQQNVVSTAQPPPLHKVVSEIFMLSQRTKGILRRRAGEKPAASRQTLEQQLKALAPILEGEVDPEVMSQIKEARMISDLMDPEMRSQLQLQIANETRQRRTISPKLSDPRKERLPVTFIEAPYRLLLSPNGFAGWAHSTTPVENAQTGRTELWHTRLGVRKDQGIDEAASYYRKLRAVWSRDFNPTQVSPGPDHSREPFRMSLDAHDRHEIVHLTSNFEAYSKPVPIDVERLMLTPLGAWMNVHGGWSSYQLNSLDLTLEEWRHRATMGRDNYVRIVYKGYLFPFGHRASLIKITERKFKPVEEGDMFGHLAAYLTQRMYIVVRQPEVVYSGFGYDHEGREMPFKRIRVTTQVTPSLDDPTGTESHIYGLPLQSAFWPRVANNDFRFHIIAEDVEGQRCEFTVPLIFVDNTVAKDSAKMGDVKAQYEAAIVSRRQSILDGQKVAFAEKGENDIENKITRDSTFETASMTFNALVPTPKMGLDSPQFLPIMDSAIVDVPALKQLLGKATGSEVAFHPAYEINGFEPPNIGEIFLKLTNEFALDFSAGNNGDKTGGMITPNINIQGISRILGPVSGSNNSKIVGGEFDPAEFFGDVVAEVLGGISLKYIIDTIGNFSEMPKLVTEKLPDEVKTTYLWKTDKLIKDPLDIFLPKDSPKAELAVDTTVRVKLPKVDDDPEFNVVGSLKNFKMNLFGFIIVSFDEFKFSSFNGSKPDVDVKISQQDGVMFGGPLAFLNELCKYIPMDGFSDPPDLKITPTGITASYSLGLPDIAFGVFSLQNVSLGAGLTIPFTGDPARVRFTFNERENPFMLTVSCIGGGGFAGLSLGLDGVEIVEASLEFGGTVAFSIGIGSGAVYATAGIYFRWGILEQTGDEGVLLSGYLRIGGAVEILGLVCISIELYMGLEYYEKTIAGEASLTITIDIVIFSKSWDITVRREFAASPPPRFADMASLSHWQTYCDAFA